MSSWGTERAEQSGRLAPLQIESTAALIATRIREGIFDGTFRPTGQLNEVQLAHELGVSRGPIREAFQRLIHEGLLRAERNRGVFVVALDEDSVRDVYLVRGVIERSAALAVAERQDPEALQGLGKIISAMTEAVDGEWADLVATDLEFHQELVAAAGSPRLSRAFEPIYAESRLCLSHLEAYYEDRSVVVAEHRAILEAIRGDDTDLIERLISAHMTESAAKLTSGAKHQRDQGGAGAGRLRAPR
jgi:DNA-binding GntR family transcriptional regulator